MKLSFVPIAFLATAALSGCGGERGISLNGPPALGPAISWTASFVQGTQTGTIDFRSVSQTATLYAAPQRNGEKPPYVASVEGSCVTLASSSVSASVQVTAAASGTCTILVGGSTVQASVP